MARLPYGKRQGYSVAADRWQQGVVHGNPEFVKRVFERYRIKAIVMDFVDGRLEWVIPSPMGEVYEYSKDKLRFYCDSPLCFGRFEAEPNLKRVITASDERVYEFSCTALESLELLFELWLRPEEERLKHTEKERIRSGMSGEHSLGSECVISSLIFLTLCSFMFLGGIYFGAIDSNMFEHGDKAISMAGAIQATER